MKKLVPLIGLTLFASGVFARFLSVDPKREFQNPYSYVGNNPIMRIDPDGREFTAKVTKLGDNRKQVEIILSGVFIDKTGKNLSSEQLSHIVSRMKTGFAEAYSRESKDGTVVFKGTLDLKVVTAASEIKKEDHVFRLRPAETLPGVLGRAEHFQNLVLLSDQLIEPGATIVRKEDSQTIPLDIGNTAAHETGHSGGLNHSLNMGTLMTPLFLKGRNSALSEAELWGILGNIKTGKTNQGKQDDR